MKNLFSVLIAFLLTTSSVFSNTSRSVNNIDTLFANITAIQANDTIISYGNDPWFVILDVRTPSEFAIKHIAEGVELDFYSSTFAATLATLNKSKVYLLHCGSGGRSAQVYTMMQNLHFRRVYNMIGGLNAWTTAGLPVTTAVAPVAGILSDTIAAFNNILLNQTDSIQLTITNAADSILSFNNITGISGTDFSTNFDTSITIPGARDYSFYVYYKPTDLIIDSTAFSIESDGGIINFYLFGTAYTTTGIQNTTRSTYSIYNDCVNHIISFRLNNVNTSALISIVDLNGKIVYEQQQNCSPVSINYSAWESSIYFLRILENNVPVTYKLPLVH